MLHQIASTYMSSGSLEQAETFYQRILAENPDDIVATKALITLHERLGRPESLLKNFERLTELEPGNFDAHNQLGRLLQQRGRFDDARRYFRQALKLNPERTDLYVELATITKYSEYSDEIALMEKRFESVDLNRDRQREIAFALGKIFDDLREYDKAFKYYSAGNQIADEDYSSSAKGMPADSIPAMVEFNQKIKKVFGIDFFRRFDAAGIDDSSIFIVTGQARSGTTLVESILDSHSLVHGTGEAEVLSPTLNSLFTDSALTFPDGSGDLPVESIRKSALSYVRAVKGKLQDFSHFVDKSLGMDAKFGLFFIMLPNAKIIHCDRDPLDQGLSYYFRDFGVQHPFCYDLQTIGWRHRLYQDLITHWDEAMPGRIYHLQYENVISDTENEVRKLLEFCGLGYESACLRFYETKRVVRTASLAQVRQPINDSSVGRWKNYQEHLEPLMQALEAPFPESQ
ncbi:MAG: sulfotransferase [Gammaproteobacteria bacterium]|nr:sulfotransferase [Gammaproteobacteria bacterium]